MGKTKVLVMMALFVAMEVILTRFLSIQTPTIRIGFGFVPIALSAILLGPWRGGLTAVLADLLGMLLFSKGMYFPALR